MAARAQGEYTPSEPESSSEDEEEEGEVDPPPLSPLHETLSPFEDIISRQGGGHSQHVSAEADSDRD
jgi:hypothetical protein